MDDFHIVQRDTHRLHVVRPEFGTGRWVMASKHATSKSSTLTNPDPWVGRRPRRTSVEGGIVCFWSVSARKVEPTVEEACLLLDQIKREKGVW